MKIKVHLESNGRNRMDNLDIADGLDYVAVVLNPDHHDELVQGMTAVFTDYAIKGSKKLTLDNNFNQHDTMVIWNIDDPCISHIAPPREVYKARVVYYSIEDVVL